MENPHLESALHDKQVLITMILIALLGAVFLKGFLEAIGVAVALVGVYLALNAVVVLTGLWHVATEGHVVTDWTAALSKSGDPEKELADTMAAATEIAMDFPRLRERLGGTAATEYLAAPDRTFEFGLDAILDGFEAQLTEADRSANES